MFLQFIQSQYVKTNGAKCFVNLKDKKLKLYAEV